ncbi:hypothetical protein EVU96_15760 [Bacillus infantis]|uniref:S-layer homology domain-containing protein n=1 Tax=Bacillus infantis TaxID=324767 RepID=UPI00101C346F|nr:S-layer homology domain-containing protein [Bacillus infantis]RYI27911.1 hypothetical protein EVU96_15760 [Bacillus infantis]
MSKTNMRKFIAGSVTAAVVASAMAPAASADVKTFSDVKDSHWAATEIYSLVEQGIINGYPDGTFRPSVTLNRGQAANLLTSALELDIPTDLSAFKDLSTKSVFAEGAAATKAAGIFGGKENGTVFGAADELTREQMASVLVRAFDLEDTGEEVSFTDWERISPSHRENVKILAQNGITTGKADGSFDPKSAVSRAHFVTFLYRAMGDVEAEIESLTTLADITVKEGEKVELPKVVEATFSDDSKDDVAVVWEETDFTKPGVYNVEGTVEGTDLKAKVKVTVEAVNPAVTEVKALNLKQVQVTFNKDVEKDSAEKLSNYSLTNDFTVADAEANGKTVVLTLSGNAAQQATAKLTVENVKDTTGLTVAKSENDVRFFDTVAPAVSSVEASGPRTITVNFSEPLQTAPTFRLDNGTLAVVNADWTAGDSEATLTLGADLSEGSHSLEVAGGTDYAGFAIEKASTSFTYSKDTAAPTVSVKSTTETQVVLQFNERVLNADNSNVEYYHTYKGTAAYKANDVSVNGNEVTLTFANPLPEGNAKLFIAYKDENGAMIQDVTGNKMAEQTLTANVSADVTAPTVTNVKAESNTQIDVTYSEAVAGATTAGNYTLKDAAGNNVAINGVTEVEGKSDTYRVTTTAPLNGGSYTLSIKNVTDVSLKANKLADFTTTVSVNDEVAPTVSEDAATQVAANKVKVVFSEVMNASSITNKANYQLNGAALASGDKIEAVDGNKAVIITLASNLTGEDNDITVGRVQDAAGNYIAAFSTGLDIAALTPVAPTAIAVTGKNTIAVTFDEVITDATVADFQYITEEDGEWKSPTAVKTSVVEGKTVIELTTEDITDTTASEVDVKTTDNVSAKNAFDNTILVTEGELEVADKYAPVLAGATIAEGSEDDEFTFELTFSESLYAASVQESDFTVAGYDVTGVTASGSTVTITAEKTSSNASATPKVTLAGPVQDSARNQTSGSQVVTATAAPVEAPASTEATDVE